jgi:hypothetical protein
MIYGCLVGPKPLARDVLAGITVSTIYAVDVERYETAILDAEEAIVVERYTTSEEAIRGHSRWCEWARTAPDGAELTRLGYGESFKPEIVRLRRPS